MNAQVRTIRAVVVLGLILSATRGLPAQQPAEKDYGPVNLSLKDGSFVNGILLQADETKITLRVGQEQRSFETDAIKPVSAAIARRKTIDDKDAKGLFELALWCRDNDLAPAARNLMAQAVRADPSYRKRAQEALAEGPAQARDEVAPIPAEKEVEEEEPKFEPATQAQIDANHKIADTGARQARKEVAKDLHLIETEHFLIYSTWPGSDDDGLKRVCEALYDRLMDQFNLKASEDVWAGKLPLYTFQEPEHFQRFATRVDKVAMRSPDMLKAGGYCSRRGDFTYVVVNGLQDVPKEYRKNVFFHVLVHETTHAFVGRFISARSLPRWLNEGLAEFMAKELVPKSYSANQYVESSKKAIQSRIDISPVFQDVPLDPFWYGISHSLVRYLVARDKKSFPKLITLIKEGTGPEEALKKSYGMDFRELQGRWRKAVASN